MPVIIPEEVGDLCWRKQWFDFKGKSHLRLCLQAENCIQFVRATACAPVFTGIHISIPFAPKLEGEDEEE